MGNLYWSCNDRFSLPGDDEDLVEGDSRPPPRDSVLTEPVPRLARVRDSIGLRVSHVTALQQLRTGLGYYIARYFSISKTR
jgi:hypothetical protein